MDELGADGFAKNGFEAVDEVVILSLKGAGAVTFDASSLISSFFTSSVLISSFLSST